MLHGKRALGGEQLSEYEQKRAKRMEDNQAVRRWPKQLLLRLSKTRTLLLVAHAALPTHLLLRSCGILG